jgi:hypothetical protein
VSPVDPERILPFRDLYRHELKEYQAAIELNENNIEARNNMAGLLTKLRALASRPENEDTN